MKLPDQDPTPTEKQFVESEPVALWSATIQTCIPYERFQDAVITAARHDGLRYTGFITRDAEGNVTSFTRTRYPRRKYDILTTEACETSTASLANQLAGSLWSDPQTEGFRVVLGLRQGYDSTNPIYSASEVQVALPKTSVTIAEVFAVRPEDGAVYTEPAAIIRGPFSELRDVYTLADTFKQERFAVEDFETGTAYMVETQYCSEPDPK